MMTEDYQNDTMIMHINADMEVAPAISLNIFCTVTNNFSSSIAAAISDAVCFESHGNRSERSKQVLSSSAVRYCSDNEVTSLFSSYQHILCWEVRRHACRASYFVFLLLAEYTPSSLRRIQRNHISNPYRLVLSSYYMLPDMAVAIYCVPIQESDEMSY